MGMKNKMLLGALLLASSVVWAAPTATAAPTGIDKYELSSFIADFTHFKPGDKVPPLYLTEEYTIKQWNLRNLPAPTAGTTGPTWAARMCWSMMPMLRSLKLTMARFFITGKINAPSIVGCVNFLLCLLFNYSQ